MRTRRLSYDEYTGEGYCSHPPSVDYPMGSSYDDQYACWDACEARFGDDLLATDWASDGGCYCQDACTCMKNIDSFEGVFLIKEGQSLPGACTDDDKNDSDDDDHLVGTAFVAILGSLGVLLCLLFCWARLRHGRAIVLWRKAGGAAATTMRGGDGDGDGGGGGEAGKPGEFGIEVTSVSLRGGAV